MWDIETDWDYAYLVAQVNGVWQSVSTSASTTTNPNGQNFGFGITGAPRGWTTITATLPAGTTAYGFRYWTDGALTRPGFAVDSIAVGGVVDNATATTGWTLTGFQQLADGQYTQGEGWSLTHKFGSQENQINITICAGLIVPAKKGFEYLWVAYEEIIDGTDLVEVPAAAYVEQVFKTGNMALIEIGA